MKPKLEINIGKLKLKNPVIVASGTFGYGKEFEKFFDIKKIGAITTKTVTLEPRLGNKPPRIIETPSGMLNAIGLQNEGIDELIENKIPALRKKGITTIVSIGGGKIEEFKVMASKLDKVKGVAAIEINVSCPNIEHGAHGKCHLFSQDELLVEKIVSSCRKATKLPLIAKLSPNVTDIKPIARAAKKGGADAIALVNTFIGLSIDTKSRASHLANITGGLSGPCIRPIACYMVREVYKAVEIPVIGMGGIMTADDALQFIIAGASAVSVGTANFIDPRVSIDILEGIKEYLINNNISDFKKLVGSLKE